MLQTIKSKWKQISEFKDLRNYYIIWIIVVFGLNLNSAIFFLYPLQLGMSFSEMMFVYFTIAQLVYFIAEIPSGIITDKYSVKRCVIIAFLLYSTAYLLRGTLPFIITPIISFLFTETLMGFADASMNGASEKYLYSFKEKVKDTKIFSTLNLLTFSTRALATLIGGIIVSFLPMNWTYILGGCIIFFGFILSIFLIKEPIFKKSDGNIIQIFKDGFKFVFNHKKTLFLILGNAFILLGLFASRNVFQPLLNNLGFNIKHFGFLFSLVFTIQMIISGFGSVLTNKIEQYFHFSTGLFWVALGISVTLLSMTFFNNYLYVIIILWLLALFEGMKYVKSTVILNRYILSEENRATINSISSMIASIFTAIFIPFIGFVSDKYGISFNLYISSLVVLLGAIILYITFYKNNI